MYIEFGNYVIMNYCALGNVCSIVMVIKLNKRNDKKKVMYCIIALRGFLGTPL